MENDTIAAKPHQAEKAAASECCTPSETTSCCAPEAKGGCCGVTQAAAPEARPPAKCGCR